MNRNPNETDEYYLQRLINHNNFNKMLFKQYLMEDCLNSLYTIKYKQHANQVIELIEKWLNDPTKVTEEQFKTAGDSQVFSAPTYAAWAAATSISSFSALCAAFVAAYAENKTTWAENKIRTNKFKQYLRFAKSLLIKPTLPQSFISFILNAKTKEELNVWLIDYTIDHNLPDVKKYLSSLYEQPFSSDFILNNPEIKTLL